jgi:hypothetical protein
MNPLNSCGGMFTRLSWCLKDEMGVVVDLGMGFFRFLVIASLVSFQGEQSPFFLHYT